MKEYLSRKGVHYQEINVAENSEARSEMVSRTGVMAVPTVAAGKEFVVGFDREKLEKMFH